MAHQGSSKVPGLARPGKGTESTPAKQTNKSSIKTGIPSMRDDPENWQDLLAGTPRDPTEGTEKKNRHKPKQNDEDIQNRTSVNSLSSKAETRSHRHSQKVPSSSRKKRENHGASFPEEDFEQDEEIARSSFPHLYKDLSSRGSKPRHQRSNSKRELELANDPQEPSKKHRVDSRAQLPIHPGPTKAAEAPSTPKGPQPKDLAEAQKRKQNVEAYIQLAKDLQKPDLAIFIEKAHKLGQKDEKTAGLVDTILSQEPTSDQIAILQTIFDDLRAENRKIQRAKARPRASNSPAFSASPAPSAYQASPAPGSQASPAPALSSTPPGMRIVKMGNKAKAVPFRPPTIPSTRNRQPNNDLAWKPFDPNQPPQNTTPRTRDPNAGPTWSDRYNPNHPAYMYRWHNYPNYATSQRKRERDMGQRRARGGSGQITFVDDDDDEDDGDDGDDDFEDDGGDDGDDE